MTKATILFLSIVCLLAGGCKSENEGEPAKSFQGENFTFYHDMRMYNEAFAARQQGSGNSFTIKDVKILRNGANSHDFLEITVTHNDGCNKDFELMWSGAVMESYPEQVSMLLRLPGSCNAGELTESILLFDLDQFIGQEELVDRATFHVLNGAVASGANDVSVSS